MEEGPWFDGECDREFAKIKYLRSHGYQDVEPRRIQIALRQSLGLIHGADKVLKREKEERNIKKVVENELTEELLEQSSCLDEEDIRLALQLWNNDLHGAQLTLIKYMQDQKDLEMTLKTRDGTSIAEAEASGTDQGLQDTNVSFLD